MSGLAVDPNGLMLAGIVGLATFALTELRKKAEAPAQEQQKMIWMAAAGVGAYFLNQFVSRGSQQEGQAISLAAMEERFEERFKTVFAKLNDLQQLVTERPRPTRARKR